MLGYFLGVLLNRLRMQQTPVDVPIHR
uniref:Uncharacterized protein n=1 Tax=Arundo donax TaxID=35708 RepID=A0A0A9BXF6_ARUDO